MDNLTKIQGTQNKIYDTESIVSYLKDYLDVALIKKINISSESKHPDVTFYSNQKFWNSAIENHLYAGQIINLNGFKILEWIPTSPGLFYTPRAIDKRMYAMESYKGWKNQTTFDEYFRPHLNPKIIELEPDGKMGMVQGGYGSLRLGPKKINNEIQFVLGASSTGVSHEGLPITLKHLQYEKIVNALKNGEIPVVNIVGRLMILPNELSPVRLRYHQSVPKFYLDVEDLVVSEYVQTNNALISVSITYAKQVDYIRKNSFSYSFCSFSPTKNNVDLKEAVSWLHNYAERYSNDANPLIIGDFDEEFDHFTNIDFPIKDIANGIISIDKLYYLKDVFNIEINELVMGDKNIFNNSNIGAVGSNSSSKNNAFQQANYSFPENFDYEKLNQQINLLKSELIKVAKTPDDFQAISNVALAENAAIKKDGNRAIIHLKDAGKWAFDTATKIGVSLLVEYLEKKVI